MRSTTERRAIRRRPRGSVAPSFVAPSDRRECSCQRSKHASAAPGRTQALLDALELFVGKVNLHAQQQRAVRLAQRIAAERARRTTVERFVEHEVERADVGHLVAVDAAVDKASEQGFDALWCYLAFERVVERVRGGEERDVGQVGLVATARLSDVGEAGACRHALALASRTSTCTRCSTTSRGTVAGQTPSSARGPVGPEDPPMNGGPLSASGMATRGKRAASSSLWKRAATRSTTSFASSVTRAASPCRLSTPTSSTTVSNGSSPERAARRSMSSAARRALASASGHE